VPDAIGVTAGDFALVTLHRPANVDDPGVLGGLLAALTAIAEECPVVFPVHPRTRARMASSHAVPDSIRLVDPLGYLDFIGLESAARIVLTDSGGVQEETTVLGIPCLTLRDNTERPITITEGTNRLVGRQPERIVAEAMTVLRDGVEERRPALWDGDAGGRIADVLLTADLGARPRPTDL
jgi:UDP-N-acetylglucosamine 2-epimerase (non-hydrolysing)